ncbi:MAG: hypothetical protein ABIH26_08765 [Candidatus Eisenbacteria bacterium]
MNAGWIGGISGAVIGLIGGVVGTYFSVKNTRGPRERAFVVKACATGWAAVVLFLSLMFVLPNPYRFLLWIPYLILLPIGIRFWNRAQQRIRREEARDQGGPPAR